MVFNSVARASFTVFACISKQVTVASGEWQSLADAHATAPSHGHISLLRLGSRLHQCRPFLFPQTPVQVPPFAGNGNRRETGSTGEQTDVGDWRSSDRSEIPSFLCTYLRSVPRTAATKIVSSLYTFSFSINVHIHPDLFSEAYVSCWPVARLLIPQICLSAGDHVP